MDLGVISLSDIQTNPATGRPYSYQQRIDEILGYATLADRSGLDVFALGEHHTLDFAVSAPPVVLAAAATRTSRIRLTSGVTVLSVLDPVRVYQDYATLDLVSHGRAEIIAGRSAFTEPFDIFGVDLADYDAAFSEKLDLLLQLRDNDHLTWSGKFRPPLHHAPITPRAAQQPLPVWLGVGGSPGSAVRAGRLGLPMMLGYIGGPLDHPRRAVELYRHAGELAGHPEKLQVGISTHFYAAATPEAARQSFPYYHQYLRPKTPGGRGFLVNQAQFEAGTTMAKLNEAGTLRVGTKFDQPLFGLKGLSGKPEGFDVEIAKLIAGEMGIAPDKIQWVETVSANREPFIQQGKVDYVVATYTINDERKKVVDFAGPYYEAGQDIMVAKGNPEGIGGPDDLAGKKVCSVTGSTPAENIRENYPEADLTEFDVYSKCAEALKNGQVQAVTTDNVILLGLISKDPEAFELVGKPFTKEPYGIGLKKGDTEFRNFINDTLEKIEQDGRWLAAWDATAGKVATEKPTPPPIDRS